MDGIHSYPSLYEEKRNFIFPRATDYFVVDKTDITVNLAPPKKVGKTSRFMESTCYRHFCCRCIKM